MIARNVSLAYLVALSWAGPLLAQMQTGTISGRVADARTMEAVAGAEVSIVGTRRGTVAAPSGIFTLSDVPAGIYRVTARFIGYAPVTHEVVVRVGQTTTVEFALVRQAVVLDEVVVTGYGSQRRVEITGSVASVNAEEADVGVITNADQLLQGRVAGVNITPNNGEPGGGVQIRIRGGTSIAASNNPLYVIDGVAISGEATEAPGIGAGGPFALPRNPLNLINPNDIESITVLKDAAAAAIYGARGANGVILIETKQGQRDRMTFEYDGYVAVSSRARSHDVLSGDEYRSFIQEQVNLGILSQRSLDRLGSASTDWQDEVSRSAVTHNHDLSFSGGTESTQYRASLGYMNQQGVTISSGLERIQARLNGTHYAWGDRLQLRLNLNTAHVRNDYVLFQDGGSFRGGVFHNVVNFNPTQPVTVTDPETGQQVFYELGPGEQFIRNPVALAEQLQDFANTTRTLGNVRAQLEILPDMLTGQVILGVDRSESTRRIYYPASNPVGAVLNGLASQRSRELTGVTFQGLMTFNHRFGTGHDVEVVGGYEWAQFDTDDLEAIASDFLTDAFSFDNLAAGSNLLTPYSFRREKTGIGVFSRITYGFDDKYFLTGVLRYDGSSVFGAANKWGVFPAVSASWRISEEGFMRDMPFSELRLRAGYGVQGNEAVPAYASLLTLQPSGGDSYPFGDEKTVGVAPSQNPNPDLKWERTSQWNVALDYGFLDNRISGSFEYYVKNTSDLLLFVTVPQPAVQPNRLENVGTVRNQGLEATLDALLLNRSNLTWEAGLTFEAQKNSVGDLGSQSFITTGFISGRGMTGAVSQRIIPGFPLGTFYGPEYAGVNEQGQQLFNDYEGGLVVGRITAADLGPDDFTVIGDANPDLVLGLHSRMTWGRLDASFLVRAKQGMDVFNNTALVYGTKSAGLQSTNFLTVALDDGVDIAQPAIYSSRWIEDGSFIRLENLTVGYTFDLPTVIGSGRTARVYVSADNLFLITGYSGIDPETHTERFQIGVRGIDYLSYPRARTFTTGVRFAF